MFKNYLNVTIRSLVKHKFYSILNILGLSAGVACFLLIILYVFDETRYDTHIQDVENIYRLDFKGTMNGNTFNTCLASVPAAEALMNDYPEVLEAVRMRIKAEDLIKRQGSMETFKEKEIVYADSNFFSFFNLSLSQGNPKEALRGPNRVAISESTARRIFGSENPMGQSLVIDDNQQFEVSGVFLDIPRNTHFHFDLIYSMASTQEGYQRQWMSFNFQTYLKLPSDFAPEVLEAKFPDMIAKYMGPEIQRFMSMSMEDFLANGNEMGYTLFPMKDIHLYSDKLGELEANGDIDYVYLFAAIAFFILMIACINFMNLATARSASRAKEVGIRKVLGAQRSIIIRQFLLEALVLSFISFLVAYGVCFVLLGNFNELAGKELLYTDLIKVDFVLIMASVMVAVGLLAGSYPALYLSKFRPAQVLKGKLQLGMKSGMIRSSLVVFQFTLSIIMIIGTGVVFDQLSFIQSKNLGFDREQVIMVEDAWLLGDKLESFKNEIVADSRITSGTVSRFLPVATSSNSTIFFKGRNPENQTHIISNWTIDHDYVKTLGLNIIDGRDFSRDFASDSGALILNQAAVKQFGLEQPVGEILSTYGGDDQNPAIESYRVIGVIEDFHYESLRQTIYPMLLYLGNSTGSVSFKINSENVSAVVDMIESKWEQFGPGKPFGFSFLDQKFNTIYESERRFAEIFSVFASLAVLIACIGLFGLAAFTAEQRTKEIGIRKVMGASITGIMTLLSKEFIKLVGISFIIAAPISYYFMNQWLDDFAYRTSLSISTLIFSGLLAFVVAWVTMSFQTWKAARLNPASSLRTE